MPRSTIVLVVALAALLAATPLVDAKKTATSTTTAPAAASTTLVRPAPGVFVIPTPVPMPAPQPAAVVAAQWTGFEAATPTPAPVSVELPLARFAPASIASTTEAGSAHTPVSTIAVASIDLPRAPASWPWTAPIVGLFAIGGVVASARLLRRPALPPPIERERMRTITLAPVDVRGILLAGKSAVEKGSLAEAVAWFTQALTLQPDLAVAHFSKGVCLAGLGKHEDAYRALRAAHDLDRAEGAVRLEYARAAARTSRAGEAMDALGPLLVALPALAEDVADDEAFASMRDHPRFLAMVGRL